MARPFKWSHAPSSSGLGMSDGNVVSMVAGQLAFVDVVIDRTYEPL